MGHNIGPRESLRELLQRMLPNMAEEMKGFPAETAFDLTWIVLADQGACDAFGGAEQRRVKAEWVSAGSPKQIAEFIRVRANASAVDLGASASSPAEDSGIDLAEAEAASRAKEAWEMEDRAELADVPERGWDDVE